jgi:V/A-type H+-transporting ATPase subunit E
MDIQLQELIEKIKKEGIESANDDALKIKNAAEAEAKRIVEAAKKEADAAAAKGKLDAERFEKAGIAAVEQASRNLVLAFKSEIEGLLGKVVSKEVAKTYDDDVLKAVIPEVVKGWLAGKGAVDLILDETRLSALKSWCVSALSAEIAQGVELKAGRNVGAGFRIGEKDGSAYYDFSASAVAGALADYLNPQLAGILKEGAKGF